MKKNKGEKPLLIIKETQVICKPSKSERFLELLIIFLILVIALC